MKFPEGTVYAIKNNRNGKIYVGKTVDLERRLKRHFHNLDIGEHQVSEMQADYSAGDDFSTAILFEGDFMEALGEIEKLYMTIFNTRNPESGYNVNEPSLAFNPEKAKFSKRSTCKDEPDERIEPARQKRHKQAFPGIRNARVKSGLKVDEVASHMGVTEGAVYQWETGFSNPDIDKLPKLAQLFGCSVDELLREPETQEADSDGNRKDP